MCEAYGRICILEHKLISPDTQKKLQKSMVTSRGQTSRDKKNRSKDQITTMKRKKKESYSINQQPNFVERVHMKKSIKIKKVILKTINRVNQEKIWNLRIKTV